MVATAAPRTTKDPDKKAANFWSALQVERLLAAHASLKDTEADVEEAKGVVTDAKKLREERWENLDKCITEAGEKFKGANVMDLDTQTAIFAMDGDYRRAIEAFELADRTYRRLTDQAKKLLERLRQIIESNREEEDLYTHNDARRKGDANAWLLVPLADLVGELIARPFIEQGINTVEDFIVAVKAGAAKPGEGWEAAGVKPAYTDYTGSRVRAYAEAKQAAGDLPREFKLWEDVPLPEVEKDKPKPEPAKHVAEEAPAMEQYLADLTAFRREAAARLGVDRGAHHGWRDVAFELTFKDAEAGELSEENAALLAGFRDWRIDTPRLFLAFLDELFETRDADKIRAEMPDVPDAFLIDVLNIVAQGLYDNGTPAVWSLMDSLRARCEAAADELFQGSRLAELATFPPEQRFGRAVPVEHQDAAGKVTREEPATIVKNGKRRPASTKGVNDKKAPKTRDAAKKAEKSKAAKPIKGAKKSTKKGAKR